MVTSRVENTYDIPVLPPSSFVERNTTSLEAFKYGVKESIQRLKGKTPVILFSTAVSAGVGYLLGGSQAASIAAKVTSASCIWICITLFFPEVVGIPSNSKLFAYRTIGGSIIASIASSLAFFAIDKFFF